MKNIIIGFVLLFALALPSHSAYPKSGGKNASSVSVTYEKINTPDLQKPSNYADIDFSCTYVVTGTLNIAGSYYECTVTATASTCAAAKELALDTWWDVKNHPNFYQ